MTRWARRTAVSAAGRNGASSVASKNAPATMNPPMDELEVLGALRCAPVPIVKCVTNDIYVPADAEYVLEGYLDPKGHVEPEGPYGEYMGYYGAIHMDPIFRCTAITMRRDALHHTLLHGSAFRLDQTDSTNISAVRTYFRFLLGDGHVVRDPSERLETPKRWRSLPDVLSVDEVGRLLAAPSLELAL